MQSITESQDLYEPISYSDVMASPNAHLWKAAIKDEYNSLKVKKLDPSHCHPLAVRPSNPVGYLRLNLLFKDHHHVIWPG
jgi:hypothetical protein